MRWCGGVEGWVTKRQLAAHLHVTPRWIELQHRRGLPRLRRDCSRPNLAVGIALDHIVVEATIAHSGQHFANGSTKAAAQRVDDPDLC